MHGGGIRSQSGGTASASAGSWCRRRPTAAVVEALEGAAVDSAGQRREPIAHSDLGTLRIDLRCLGNLRRQPRMLGHDGECTKRLLHHIRAPTQGGPALSEVFAEESDGRARHRRARSAAPRPGAGVRFGALRHPCGANAGHRPGTEIPPISALTLQNPHSPPNGKARNCTKSITYRQTGTISEMHTRRFPALPEDSKIVDIWRWYPVSTAVRPQ